MATKRTTVEHKVTSIHDFIKQSQGEVVELPGFTSETVFVKLKRPSLLGLVKQGKIPNALLTRTNELFSGDAGIDPTDDNMMAELSEVLELIAGESFVEPTYQEIKDAGVELTDEQLMAVFNYSQKGVKGLESFRTE